MGFHTNTILNRNVNTLGEFTNKPHPLLILKDLSLVFGHHFTDISIDDLSLLKTHLTIVTFR